MMHYNQSIQSKIIKYASDDERIRAVILNGSRANPKIVPDKYQDYDILFVVKNLEYFKMNKDWLSFLGKPILMQLPDEMVLFNTEGSGNSYGYLMIFNDGSRVDLTLFEQEKFSKFVRDSLTVVWFDKDHLFDNLPPTSDKDYHITKPDETEFNEVCNEFWWCSTNVGKGLARKEVIYAKEMMERYVRPMFARLLEWKIGSQNNFGVSAGKSLKFVKNYLGENDYRRILTTYSDAEISNNWRSLFQMTSFFSELQQEIAAKLQFNTDLEEIKNAIEYLRKLEYE